MVKVIAGLSIAISIIVAAGLTAYVIEGNKTGFVDINTLYDGYNQKKELEKQFQKEQMQQTSLLDSLKIEIQLLENRVKEMKASQAQYAKNVEYYNYISSEFDRVNKVKANQYKEQILKQLNQYVSDYGKINKFKYIYGANGNGSLMYAADNENLTAKILLYANRKYEGKE